MNARERPRNRQDIYSSPVTMPFSETNAGTFVTSSSPYYVSRKRALGDIMFFEKPLSGILEEQISRNYNSNLRTE